MTYPEDWSPTNYILHNNIARDYKKDQNTPQEINLKAKHRCFKKR